MAVSVTVPRRRRNSGKLSRGLLGAAEGFGQGFDAYLRFLLQDTMNKNVLDRQKTMEEIRQKEAIAEEKRKQEAKIPETISSADELSKLPTDVDLQGLLQAAGRPVFEGESARTTDVPGFGRQPGIDLQLPSPQLTGLQAQRGQREGAIRAAMQSKIDAERATQPPPFLEIVGPNNAMQKIAVDPYAALKTGEVFQTSRTPQQQGEYEGEKTVNEIRVGGPAKARQAGAEAGAQATARIGPELKIHQGKADIDVTTKGRTLDMEQERLVGSFKPTDAEKTAKAYADRALESHNQMLKLEQVLFQKGRGLKGKVLTLAELNTPAMIQDPVRRQYAVSLSAFINAGLGRPESGGQISQQEYDTYGKQVGIQGWEDLGTAQTMQQNRRGAIEGLATKAGGLGRVFVTQQELQDIAANNGTTMEAERARALAEGYKVIF